MVYAIPFTSASQNKDTHLSHFTDQNHNNYDKRENIGKTWRDCPYSFKYQFNIRLYKCVHGMTYLPIKYFKHGMPKLSDTYLVYIGS